MLLLLIVGVHVVELVRAGHLTVVRGQVLRVRRDARLLLVGECLVEFLRHGVLEGWSSLAFVNFTRLFARSGSNVC